MYNFAIVATGSTPTVLENITAQISPVFTMMGELITSMFANPLFAFLMAVGFIGIGLRVFRKVKGASSSN